MVLGIIGLVTVWCYGFGIIFSVLAIVLGKMGMTKAEQGRANNLGTAKAGFVMGIIGTALGALIILGWILFWVFVVAASSTTSIN